MRQSRAENEDELVLSLWFRAVIQASYFNPHRHQCCDNACVCLTCPGGRNATAKTGLMSDDGNGQDKMCDVTSVAQAQRQKPGPGVRIFFCVCVCGVMCSCSLK